MAASTGRWFGFGFNQFGQVANRREREGDGKVLEPVTVTVHSPEKAGQWPADRSSLRKMSPAWSYTACLGGDGSTYLFGFVDGRPWQQMCINNQAHQDCTDILSSEKYLLMLWQDRVECRDIQKLCTGEVTGDLTWTRQLKEGEKQCTALPLIPGGYVTTTPPFYKPLSPQLRAKKLALGSEHAVLLNCDLTVYSWGSGRHGQLGHGGVEDEAEPRIVEALHGLAMAEVAAGGWHSVSSSASGDLYVWGWNESGQLGLPAKSCSEEKQRKTSWQKGLSGEVTPSLSDANNRVIKSANKKADGDDSNVFISIQAFPALLDLPEESEVSKVSCGSRHSAVITREGNLFTWGWGNYGQLGHGQTNSSDLPRLVEYFVQNHLSVLDVVCGTWNTFVFAQQEEF
ncbi:RCC1 domain-containing protein 1-like isoform X1 [Chiloscyllium plagiosum]|uniref:RCC1 domain-containing protein 1-like isoform X1 n=1 Tax=Chiloscyllium plagiosum TaxID=36176 RepID=UPI001CB7EE25|nr:RCC1 domain-containing protein 1-like isoform X1 [Chiloscyllium plagiosum]